MITQKEIEQVTYLSNNTAFSERGFIVCVYKDCVILGQTPTEVAEMLSLVWKGRGT